MPVLSLRQNGPAHFTRWEHSPLRALNQESIRFSVEVSSNRAILSAELYVYEYELFLNKLGQPSQRKRANGQWGQLASFPQSPDVTDLVLGYTYEPGFSGHTRIEYIWRITDTDGAVTDRLALTDVGTSPWPTDKVLLYAAARSPMTEMIDIAFFRDLDYGDQIPTYYRDLERMVLEGFFGSDVFNAHREMWAFYTTDRVLNGKALAEDITNDALLPGFLKDFSIPGIDAFCLLHREDYTDRSLLLENFHSLSNNLFSAEAHNWGTAVHECGHAIFHLSDEYEGCACFQTHSGSNVYRQRSDCVAWNMAQGFPATDCYELVDVYQRKWWSAEEPTFFANLTSCQEHNRKLGLSLDSCRTFIDEVGKSQYWSFESTCIMHDDGDDHVRPFQRACRRVIEDQLAKMRHQSYNEGFAKADRDNIYGYQPVVLMAMHRKGKVWSLDVESLVQGVPTQSSQAGGEVLMRVVDNEGKAVASYQLANAGAVHSHGSTDRYQVPQEGIVRVAVPASLSLERVSCEYNADAIDRNPNPEPALYAEGFVFEIGERVRHLLSEQK